MPSRSASRRASAPVLAATVGLATALSLLALDDANARDRWSKSHRHHQHGHRAHIVDAPFTRVVKGRRAHTEVYAPFTFVRTSGRRVWVRAPFVNLYVSN